MRRGTYYDSSCITVQIGDFGTGSPTFCGLATKDRADSLTPVFVAHPLDKSWKNVPLWIFCLLFLTIVASCTCQTIQGVEKYGQSITKVHYISPQLLSSEEFRAAVGVPLTNSIAEEWKAVIKAKSEAPSSSPQHQRASDQEQLTIAIFNGVLGHWFKLDQLPATSNLLSCAFDDTWVVAHKAKAFHYKARPVEIPGNSSYPSAHAMEGEVISGILNTLDATHTNEVVKLGKEIGENRLILQRHFPSDIQAGRTLGDWLLKKMAESKAFQSDLAAAQREIGRHLKAH